MKTAISIPDVTYDKMGRIIKKLKMSRSRFFLEAAEAYLRKYDKDSITDKINEFIAENGQTNQGTVLKKHVNRMILKVEW